MGFFKRWKEKRQAKKQQTKEIKHPDNSYDIYNQNETAVLQTEDVSNKPEIAYSEEQSSNKETKTAETGTKSKKSSSTRTTTTTVKAKKDNTRTTTTRTSKDSDMAKGRNIYYVSVRKDKNGKKIGWEVKKENADKVTKVCETKEQAIDFVREKAGNQGSTCIIRKVDGSIDKTMKFDTK